MNNPYTAPETQGTSNISGITYDYQKIAKYQRFVNIAVLLNLLAIPLFLGFSSISPDFGGFIALAFFGLTIGVGFIGVIGLGRALKKGFLSVIIALGLFTGIFGFLGLLLLNSSASKVLRNAGYKVGFLGGKV